MELNNRRIFEVDGIKYIFFAKDLEIVQVDDQKAIRELYKLKAQQIDALYPPIEDKDFSANNLQVLSINLVNGCNLNCSYCFVGAYQRKNQLLSEKEFREYLHFFDVGNKDKIAFYFSGGGEPLLNFKLIQKIPEICKEFGTKNVYIELNTNGTLITDEIASFFTAHGFIVNVSMDGKKESHNKNRMYHNGKGSFDEVMRGLNILKKYKLDYAGKTVIDPSKNDIAETFDFFETNTIPFVFDIVTPSITGHFKPKLKDLDNFSLQFAKIIDNYATLINNNQKVYALKILRDMQKLHQRRPRIRGCGACISSIHIDIAGNVYSCAYNSGNSEYAIGNIHTSLRLVKAKEYQWYAKNVCDYKPCNVCWVRHLCGGSCFSIKNLINGNPDIPYSFLCKWYIIYFSNIIRLYIKTYNSLTNEKNINCIL
jgi:uncharacterized protein